MAIEIEQLRSLLVDSGAVTQKAFDDALARKETAQVGIENSLLHLGYLTDEQLGSILAIHYDVPFVDLRSKDIKSEDALLIPEAFAREQNILPIESSDETVSIATSTPDNALQRSLVEKYLRKEVKFFYATPRDIKSHMYIYRRDPQKAFTEILKEETGSKERDTRTIHLVGAIIDYAYHAGASDIHIEPEEDYVKIRYREDGVLHDIAELPQDIHDNILTRLKVLARLATDEHRVAQDGKVIHSTEWGEQVEIRLSVVPTTHAEKAVMRLLTDKSRSFSLTDLGLSSDDYKKVSESIHKPWGAILVTGPTGSGKTTSLYAMLQVLNQPEVNVTTIEDPVEFDMEGVAQIQVNEKAGLTFAKGLRSIVRQDPDIIMVGEIRDTETANIAVNAAMTGHLVLSTLHTNDAATAFPRLQDMGVEEFLVGSTVNVIIAQRLVRKTCRNCLTSVKIDAAKAKLFENTPGLKEYFEKLTGKKTLKGQRLYEGKGCQVCRGSGFHGRAGVFEVLTMSDKIRTAVMEKKTADEIREIAVEEGMTTMLHDGLQKVVLGQTTIEEVLRVVKE